jgi:hypothetical protein
MTRALECSEAIEARVSKLAQQRGASVKVVAVQELAAHVLNADT